MKVECRRLSGAYATALMHMDEDKRKEVRQLLLDVLDVCEQTDLGDDLYRAFKIFDEVTP